MDVEEPYFTGIGEPTCHHFIRFIREAAIKAGKARDEAWMADQASIHLDGDALKWFESLDDEVQGDWKRLRRALLARYAEPAYEETPTDKFGLPNKLLLTGESESENQEFVKRVRESAASEGKERDSEWMLRLAFPCFQGRALKWHASLPFDVQINWRLLERAILLDFPHRATETTSPARIQVNDWYSPVPASNEMHELTNYEAWIRQAKERRRLYEQLGNKTSPCWLLIDDETEIPENAIRTGTDKDTKPLFSARAWYKDSGVVVGKCGRHLSGAHLPLHGVEVISKPFEILVGNPSHVKWVAVAEKQDDRHLATSRPFVGLEAGLETGTQGKATFIAQTHVGNTWHPGKCHSGWTWSCTGHDGKELGEGWIRVLAWAD